MQCVPSVMIAYALVVFVMSNTGHADPNIKDAINLERPESLTVIVGDLLIRIDGSKMWTLSGIDYQKNVIAVQDSAYGSILTIRGVGTLGSAHFLDIPNKPGEVEKENVTHVQFFVDDQLVKNISPTLNVTGNSFRMERRSAIRSVNIESSLSLRDGVLMESAAAGIMYAWTPAASVYLYGDDKGILNRGTFLNEPAKPTEGGDKSARWMAVYDPHSGTGAVCYVVKQPTTADAWLQFTDAPRVYRKMRLLGFPEKIMPAGFDGTFQTATGFFSAVETEWEAAALQLSIKLKSLAATINQQ